MSNLFLFVGFVLVLSCSVFARQEADELLAEFFLEYDDFYDESFLRYKGTQWVEGPDVVGGRFRVWEGIVANSVAKKMQYVLQLDADADAKVDSQPTCNEVLTVDGKTLIKGYVLSNEWPLSNKAFEPDVKQKPIIPILEPHGLATLPYMGIFGRGSEFKKHVSSVLTGFKFVKSTSKKDGVSNGTWISSNGIMQLSIDLDTKRGNLPILAEYSISEDKKAATGRFSSITKTKWKKFGEKQNVPQEILVSGLLGESKYEYVFTFDWIAADVWKEKIKNTDFAEISRRKGRGWFDAFNALLEK